MFVSNSTIEQRVQQLVAAGRGLPDEAMSLELFHALGWQGNGYYLDHYQRLGEGNTYRMVVDGETTAHLVVTSDNIANLENYALKTAYNSGVDYLAISNFATTKLVHSRWIDDPTCFDVTAWDYASNIGTLSLLSPQSIISGKLAAHTKAVKEQKPRKVLLPIDQELIDRLSRWRQLLLSQSQNVTDEQIHELFGRLFFIRSCEDRLILPKRPLLGVLHQSTELPLSKRLLALFDDLSKEFGPELFLSADSLLPDFDDAVLLRIVNELYNPFPGLPHYQYDFAHLTVDILGKIYEQYVSVVLAATPVADQDVEQLTMFDIAHGRRIEQRTQRRERGVFFTPPYLVNYIVQKTVGKLATKSITVDTLPRVADISCGSGVFLTHVVDNISRSVSQSPYFDGKVNPTHEILTRIVGVDIDPRAVTLARVNLWILATMSEPARPLPELRSAVFADNALISSKLDELKGQFDVVVGNPPFRSSIYLDLPMQERLRRRYVSAKGRFDQAYVFIERALQLVKPGGYLGLVLTNRIFGNSDARHIRELIAQQCFIEEVIDFGNIPIFEEGDSYACILILRKRQERLDELAKIEGTTESVFVHKLLLPTEYIGLQLRRPDYFDGRLVHNPIASRTNQALQPVGGGPWIWWSTGTTSRILQKLQVDSIELGKLADLHQGIKTGNNEVFLLTLQDIDQNTGRWKMKNGRNEVVELEPDLLHPSAQGSTIQRYLLSITGESRDKIGYVLYPYSNGRLLEEYELQARVPYVYAYLNSHKKELLQREVVRNGGAWYVMSRSRASSGWIEQPKILSRLLVTEPSFAFDEQGAAVPIGGSAIVSRDATKVPHYLLLGVLNSAIMSWYLLHAQAARYRGDYIEIAQRELKKFPFPIGSLLTEPALAKRIATLARGASRVARLGLNITDLTEEIDDILFELIGFEDQERQEILNVLADVRDSIQSPVQTALVAEAGLEVRLDLEMIENYLTELIESPTIRNQELVLMQVSNALLTMVEERFEDEVLNVPLSLLTMAMLSAQKLSRRHASFDQLQVLRDIIQVCKLNPSDRSLIGIFEKRLRAEGISVLPSIPNAGSSMTIGDDEEDADKSRR